MQRKKIIKQRIYTLLRYSYLYEAFEVFHNMNDSQALKCFKYLLLCKIMTNSKDEINSLLNSKYGMKYEGRDLEAMKGIFKSNTKNSILEFRIVTSNFEKG